MTRFLRNPAVKPEEMVSTAAARTAERCIGRRVLVVQDTTVVRPGPRRGTGLFLHVALAIDADDGAILGLADASLMQRDGSRGKEWVRRARLPDKQMSRWMEGLRAAGRLGAAQACVIADRESDMLALFTDRPDGVDLLVRARHDRALGDGGRLFARVDASGELGRVLIELPAKPGRAPRRAELALRAVTFEPAEPGRGGRGRHRPAGIRLHLVDVREVDPPPGAEAVHWRLLTTLPAADLPAALAVVDLYRRRWAIEQLFRTMKTHGFDIENVEVDDADARRRLVMATLVAAVVVQQLVHARDGQTASHPPRPLDDAFSPDDAPFVEAIGRSLEGATARQKNPHPPGTLAFAAWVCARLGGWTGYYGKPGPIVILRGWLELTRAKRALEALVSVDV